MGRIFLWGTAVFGPYCEHQGLRQRGWFPLVLLMVLPSAARAAAPADGAKGSDLARRVALVIGNQAYPGKGDGQRGAVWGELRAPVSDARKVAQKLARPPLGFSVTLLENLGRRETQGALETFYQKIRGADVALFYFSGHGFSASGQSYLVPVDVLDRGVVASSGPPKFVPVQQVAAEIKRRASYGLLFLDACRDEAGGGFLRIDGIPSNPADRGQIFVSYAAPLGRRASDARDGQNSPYTTALLHHLDKPDQSIQQLMAEVGKSMSELTRNPGRSRGSYQEHQLAGSINDPLYLAGQTDPGVLARAREAAHREQALWDEARTSRARADVWLYMRRYPQGRFAPAAYDLLDHIDWDEAKRQAQQTRRREPIDDYLAGHEDGLHRKEALDWMRPAWKKPALWLGLSAGLVAAGAAIGLGVALSQQRQDLTGIPGGNPNDWMKTP